MKTTMRSARALLLTSLVLLPGVIHAQQVPDLSYNPPIANPAYPTNQGPLVLVDEAHYNFHTLSGAGRYQPFAQLLRRDGYVVNSLRSTFSSESLGAARILVVANALAARNQERLVVANPFSVFQP